VAINPDYSSRGYGFALFQKPEDAKQAIEAQYIQIEGKNPIELLIYNPRDRKDMKRIVNNIYVKNFPADWDEAKLREIFSKYGDINSMKMMSVLRSGQEQESKFALICYSKKEDLEYGPRCAQNAIDQENEKVYDGQAIYVREALKKAYREIEKRKE